MTIKTRNIADGAVTSAKIAADAVTNAKFGSGGITAASMNADAAGAHPLANSSGLYGHRICRLTLDPTGVAADRALGAHSSTVNIPAGAILAGGFTDVITALDSGTSTAQVSVGVVTNIDVVAAAVVSGAPWSTTGAKACILKANTPEHATAGLKLAAAAALHFTVTVEALTVGKCVQFVYYTLSSVT